LHQTNGNKLRPTARPGSTQKRERADRAELVRKIWAESEALAGAPGERHLVELRGITAPVDGWPRDAARHHASDRAAVFATCNDAGEPQALHRIFLTAAGGNITLPPGWKSGRLLPTVRLCKLLAQVLWVLPSCRQLGRVPAFERVETPGVCEHRPAEIGFGRVGAAQIGAGQIGA
jgi:hypothetical protein